MKKPFAGMFAALLLLLLLCQQQVQANGDLIMVRAAQAFPEAMLALQDSIRGHGYQVSRVQRIDVGLTGMGYRTDKYRVVFAGKPDEIRMLSAAAPELVPYLPPKIAIFAEEGQTVLVTLRPSVYADIAGDAVDHAIFRRWDADLRSILARVVSATD